MSSGWNRRCLGPDPAEPAIESPGAGPGPHFPGGWPCFSHTRSPLTLTRVTKGHKEGKVTAAPQGWPTRRLSSLLLLPLPHQHDTFYWTPPPSKRTPALLISQLPFALGPWCGPKVSEPHHACRFSSAALVGPSSSGPVDTGLILVLGGSAPRQPGAPESRASSSTVGSLGDGALWC